MEKLQLIRKGFYCVAGWDACQAEDASRKAHIVESKNRPGSRDSGSVVHWQTHAGREFRSVEICDSIYGYSVRASSGLDGFALLAGRGDLDGSFEQAQEWAEKWVDYDPAHRYAFIRDYDLARRRPDLQA